MTTREFTFEHADGIGIDLPGGVRIEGGFAGRFVVSFDVDFPPEITNVWLETSSGEVEALHINHKMGLRDGVLRSMIEPQLMRTFKNAIDEANTEICAGRAAREERSQRAYHQWQSL